MTDIANQHPGYSVYFDYRVDINRRRNRVTASLGDRQLAQSERTLLVDEQDHGLVFYFPKADVDFSALKPVHGHHTRCPWKGEASYWSLIDGEERVAWAYEDPLPQVAQIRDHIAFYQNIVTVALGVAPYLPRWSPGAANKA
ncbi:MAG: DUF427 domain-containing protein [Alphaproteobacteria bacterium]|nr:DUF427 domain-containing protein [Alphaproteobacteria bacterium]